MLLLPLINFDATFSLVILTSLSLAHLHFQLVLLVAFAGEWKRKKGMYVWEYNVLPVYKAYLTLEEPREEKQVRALLELCISPFYINYGIDVGIACMNGGMTMMVVSPITYGALQPADRSIMSKFYANGDVLNYMSHRYLKTIYFLGLQYRFKISHSLLAILIQTFTLHLPDYHIQTWLKFYIAITFD